MPFGCENQAAIIKEALGRAGAISEPGAIVALPSVRDDPTWLAGA